MFWKLQRIGIFVKNRNKYEMRLEIINANYYHRLYVHRQCLQQLFIHNQTQIVHRRALYWPSIEQFQNTI